MNLFDETGDTYGTMTSDVRGNPNYIHSKNQGGISKELESAKLPDDIRNQAELICNQMSRTVHRGKKRSQLLFYCTYQAYRELGQRINPVQLGDLFKLTPGQVQKSLSLFSHLQTGYKPVRHRSLPNDFIGLFGEELGLSAESIDELHALSDRVLARSVTLREAFPQTVAAGLIKYYRTINGISDTDSNRLYSVTTRSEMTVEAACKQIAMIDNSAL
jgi:hypothetical protein